MVSVKSVILYSTGCPKCDILKKKLNEKNIEFVEETSVKTMLELNITQVPVLCVNGKMMDFTEAVKWVNAVKEMN